MHWQSVSICVHGCLCVFMQIVDITVIVLHIRSQLYRQFGNRILKDKHAIESTGEESLRRFNSKRKR